MINDPSIDGLPQQRFQNQLTTGPLLVNGGIKTLLFSRGVPQRACLEELVASQPGMVGAAHREYLEKNGVPHSLLRRLLLFVHHVVVTRAHDANTLRYLWIEAGYDQG